MKINWQEFGLKLWNEGVKSALDVVVDATDNPWDNATVQLLDQVVIKLLPLADNKEEK
jgi:hypothetical protein|tara:strand:+ start:515 stop:688 length:174 start_codon:yes stop_codon:yes gene_type:complete